MVAAVKFWDNIAEKYAASPVRDPAAYEATLARVKEHIPADANALEVGCGTGTTALKLAPYLKHLTASDISGKMIDIAEGKRVNEGVTNVDFVRATLQENDFTLADYDVVLAFNFLHLTDDIPSSLDAIHALTKPGGLFISKTVCLGDWNIFLSLMIKGMQLIGKAPPVKIFKADALDAMVNAAGFDIFESDYFPKKARNRFLVARKR